MSKIQTFASNQREFSRNSGEFTVRRRHFVTQSFAAGSLPEGANRRNPAKERKGLLTEMFYL